jgi:UDP-N-acetylglucosamine 2-epimerase (non-hydrolysing)
VKVLTILGTRPEIIRLSLIIGKLDRRCEHTLVHTGQNFEAALSDIFFKNLGVRQPDRVLGVRGDTFAQQAGQILVESERVMRELRPDRLLILGDTNSGLSVVVAKREGIPVYHMEAGNRCYDDRVPEEVNRRIIDHCSNTLMPYTERSRANLMLEGIPAGRIVVTGNPIYEVMQHYIRQIDRSNVLTNLRIEPGRYFLVTIHRAENVDVESRLRHLCVALERLQRDHGIPVIISTHPRTALRLKAFGIEVRNPSIRFLPPFDFFDFIHLERHAQCVLTDSGTVQEECCILGVPNVTVRDVTERPETIDVGSNILAGVEPERILGAVQTALSRRGQWTPPAEYTMPAVSETAVNIILGGA